MGVGIIARDHGGRFLAAKCMNHPRISDPAVAEAFATWAAVEFGMQMAILTLLLRVIHWRWLMLFGKKRVTATSMAIWWMMQRFFFSKFRNDDPAR